MRAFFPNLLRLAAITIAACSKFATSVASGTGTGPFIVKHTTIPPRHWVEVGIPPRNHLITLHIGLPQPNFHVLERRLYDVSDPSSSRYGAHLTRDDVHALVAPHQETLYVIDKWLASHGVKKQDVSRSPAKDWVKLTVSVTLAESMLDAKYSVWAHNQTGDVIVRALSYSLPQGLLSHIDVVQPTTMFAQFQGMRSTINWPPENENERLPFLKNIASKYVLSPSNPNLIDPTCNSMITIRCLQQLYNTIGYNPTVVAPQSSIAVTGFLEQYANAQDLHSFFTEQRPEAVNSGFQFFSINGGLNNQSLVVAGAEANLDVQFGFGMAFPIPGTFYSTGGRPPFVPDALAPSNTNEPYREWLDFVLSQSEIPLVISTSYGEHEQTVPEEYARRVCADFAQLGARGVSVIFSSGDHGVGDGNPNPATQTCFTNDGRNIRKFLPMFPASCPYVTAVGGTQYTNPEVAVSRYFSGGGFSDYWKRPAYQEKAVKSYLDALPRGLYEGLYSRTGRGYPDVAAQGDRFRVWLAGRPRLIGGTSASAPVFAGIVALLNNIRLVNGRSPLGFLNPWLYSSATQDFNDITIGNNGGCGTLGFNATSGWDPVTGLGTPNFSKLAVKVLQS